MFQIPPFVHTYAQYYGDPSGVPAHVYAEVREGMKKFQVADPQVSVVIIAYNEEQNLLPTLLSLSKQEVDVPTEVIVVNNNSTDGTQALLDRCGVRSELECRQGIGWARQCGLEAAQGACVINGDADSIYPPTWSKQMAKPLIKKEVSVVYSRYSFIPGEDSNRTYLKLHEWIGAAVFRLRRRQADTSNVMGFSFAFRRQDAIDVGGFPVTGKHRWEDGLLVHKLHRVGKIHLVQDAGARVWTSDRRLLMDGSYAKAFFNRVKHHGRFLPDYVFFKKKTDSNTDA